MRAYIVQKSRAASRPWLVGILAMLVVAYGCPLFGGTTDPKSAKSVADALSVAFESASQKVGPSVVPIFAEQSVSVQNPFGGPGDPLRDFFGDEFFKRFFGQPQGGGGAQKQTVRSMGSGVIVSADGLILTNNHVVSGADKLTVVLADGRRLSATVIGTDPQTDVAVIKVDDKNLPVAQLGNSDQVKVGQWVIAVGNPFQLLHSVTAGIISAKGRSSIGLADYEDFIQTDASINPGNSGGALCDLDGNVIGINTAISSPSGASAGVGFAIPINMAQSVMHDLIDNGKVTRGYLAVMVQNIDDDLQKAMDLKSKEGALVGDVTPGGPADKAGIKRGDVIVEYQGKKITNSRDLRNKVAETRPKTKTKIELLRDGHTRTVTVVLGERPVERAAASGGQGRQPAMNQKLGLGLQDLTPDVARQLGYDNDHGVLVTSVASGSPAEDAGMRRGDLIKEVNQKPVSSVEEFAKVVSGEKSGDSLLMLVRRGDNSFFIAIPIA